MSGFVGRGPEFRRIHELLSRRAQLVTLVGPGGIGKTRLAEEALGRYQRETAVPVHWVRLALLDKRSSTRSVEEEVVRSVVESDFSDRSGWESLLSRLGRTDSAGRELQTILVLDNGEHVLDAVAEVCTRLLAALPGLTIVMTTRESLGWIDEYVVSVPPLSDAQAARLFRERAEFTGREVSDSPDEISMVRQICLRVDSYPLYIRLAAGRLLNSSLAMVLRDLSGGPSDRRMRWEGPRVGGDERHRRVIDVIGWSYDLCSAEERLLLDRMSVFAAGHDISAGDADPRVIRVGVDLDAVVKICADDAESGDPRDESRLREDDIESLLDRLVEQSLVIAHIGEKSVRYSLLESIRLFAAQRLEQRSDDGRSEVSRMEQRHLEYYRDMVLAAESVWFSAAEQAIQDWACASWDNIIAAIERSSGSAMKPVAGLEISCGLTALGVPFSMGAFREIRRWIERTLSAAEQAPRRLRLRALCQLAWLMTCQGIHQEARSVLGRAVALCLDAETVTRWRETPESDFGLPAIVEFVSGAELLLARADPRSIVVLARARERMTGLGSSGGAAIAELLEAEAAGYVGTADQALEVSYRHHDNAIAAGASGEIARALLTVAVAELKFGDPRTGLAAAQKAAAQQLAVGDKWTPAWALQIQIWARAHILADAIRDGGAAADIEAQAVDIARLIGGYERLRAMLFVDIDELGPMAIEQHGARDMAGHVLGDERFAVAESEGRQWSAESGAVHRLALGVPAPAERAPEIVPEVARQGDWSALTATERDIAALVVEGRTNRQIADRRGSAVKTVDAQVRMIFKKLRIHSRADIGQFLKGQ